MLSLVTKTGTKIVTACCEGLKSTQK